MTTTDQSVARNRFIDTFGYPSSGAVTKVKDHLTAYAQEFIKNSPFAVVASSDASGLCDASPKGGKPGFVLVLDEKHLLFPDVAGNKLFQTYQNVESNQHVGLVFMIPGVNDTVRVNGRATILNKEELDRRKVELSLYELDDRSRYLQGMLIEVAEAYPHCPRAFNFSRLWDVDKISANQKDRPVPLRIPGT
jgi:PPOX class probable FMN-dependent enzyme